MKLCELDPGLEVDHKTFPVLMAENTKRIVERRKDKAVESIAEGDLSLEDRRAAVSIHLLTVDQIERLAEEIKKASGVIPKKEKTKPIFEVSKVYRPDYEIG